MPASKTGRSDFEVMAEAALFRNVPEYALSNR